MNKNLPTISAETVPTPDELYSAYEENNMLHVETAETIAAEQELTEFLHSLPAETMFQLDMLVGKLARAYEKQGFLFGLNCASAKEAAA